jgi:SAM-dependent methyltransferase
MLVNLVPEQRIPEFDLTSHYARTFFEHNYGGERYAFNIFDYGVFDRIVEDLLAGVSQADVDLTGLVVKNSLSDIVHLTPKFGPREQLFFLESLCRSQSHNRDDGILKVLEVGAGTAMYAYPFVNPQEMTTGPCYEGDIFRRKQRVYVASDASILFTRIARVIYDKAIEALSGGLYIRTEDVTRLNERDNEYNIVVSEDMLHDVNNLQAAIREMIRVTKPGGFIAISDYARDLMTPSFRSEEIFTEAKLQEYMAFRKTYPKTGELSIDMFTVTTIGSWLASYTLADVMAEIESNGIPSENIRIVLQNNLKYTLVAQKPPRSISLKDVKRDESNFF